jgi:hypothetical protein
MSLLLHGLLGIGKGKTVWRVVEVWGEHWNCEREGTSSNPGVAQVFFLFFGILSIRKVVHLPAVDHKQKIHHKLDYPIATCQFVPQIQGTSTSACDHNPRIVATIHALVGLTHCGYHW